MFKVQIECLSFDEMRAKISSLHTQLTGLNSGHSEMTQDPKISYIMLPKTGDSLSEEKTEKQQLKRGKQKLQSEKTSETALEIIPKTEIKAEAKAVTDVKITKADAFSALQELNVAKGLNEAREVLKTFGCARISDVKPEDYAAFVSACKAALA